MVLSKIIISNHISELLKMQLESRSRNVHTKGIRSGFISTHAVTTQKGIRVKPRICVRLEFVYNNHCFINLLVLGSSSTYSSHINHSGQDSLTKNFFFEPRYFGPDLRLARTKTVIPFRSVKNADGRLQTGYKMRTADRVLNADREFILFLY